MPITGLTIFGNFTYGCSTFTPELDDDDDDEDEEEDEEEALPDPSAEWEWVRRSCGWNVANDFSFKRS